MDKSTPGPATNEMSATSLASVFQHLDEEMFFAILDVALDIETKLLVREQPIYIPIRRVLVRYEILCPMNTPGMVDRYCELRWDAGEFLRRQGIVDAFEFHEQGGHRWYGVVEVTVPDTKRLAELLVELRREEIRRNPRRQMDKDISSATARLSNLADSFHRVALRLRTRYDKRSPFLINDEYDVQDLFAALLETQFSDIRREEWGPSYAGGATRVDFFLKQESVLFETKMTRANLLDRKLGEELIVDIEHYKQRADCKALVCFAYDPDHVLRNPAGLENDLSRQEGALDVRVLVRPKR